MGFIHLDLLILEEFVRRRCMKFKAVFVDDSVWLSNSKLFKIEGHLVQNIPSRPVDAVDQSTHSSSWPRPHCGIDKRNRIENIIKCTNPLPSIVQNTNNSIYALIRSMQLPMGNPKIEYLSYRSMTFWSNFREVSF